MLAQLVRKWSIQPRELRKLAEGVQRLVQENVSYLREHPETYQHPVRTLALHAGDCDDMVILVCSLLRSAKIPCRATFAWWQEGPVRKGHVWSEAFVDGAWLPLETVRKLPAGFSPLEHLRSKGHDVRSLSIGDPTDGPRAQD